MTRYLARGLLVLALCGWAVGCGDDDDSGGGDSGIDSGAGGSGGTGGGGTGGSNDAGNNSGDGGSGGSISMPQCVSMTNTNSGNMAEAACVSCVCMKDVETTVACKSDCWALNACVSSRCGNSATTPGCLTDANKCGDEFAAASSSDSVTPATNLRLVITSMCSSECVASSSGNDGGAEDAGN